MLEGETTPELVIHEAESGDIFDQTAFENADITKISNAIDRFRELGLAKEFSLPQLVVAGDQSAGKSSLLENLTGLPFPVKSDVCTRFATEITLHPGPQKQVTASLGSRPSPGSKEEAHGLYRRYDRFEARDFRELIEEATKTLGLPTSEDQLSSSESGFSEQILHIDVTGPNHSMLSFMDTPGVFRSGTITQRQEDAPKVRNLVKQLIAPHRTIIVLVMSARNDAATQEIFNLKDEVDRAGARTVGVLTMCDAVQEGGEEKRAIQMAQNKKSFLSNGWYVVKNKKPKDQDAGVSLDLARESEKEFLAQKPWCDLPSRQRGISALRQFLAEKYAEHVKKEFPKLQNEMRVKLDEQRAELDKLGPPRHTAEQQRAFLLDLVRFYWKSIRECKDRNSASAKEDHRAKIWLHVERLSREFCTNMGKQGAQIPFRNVQDEFNREEDKIAGLPFDRFSETETTTNKNMEKTNNIYEWINREFHTSMNRDCLGLVSPELVERMFKSQTEPWLHHSQNYIGEIIVRLKDLSRYALEQSETDARVIDRLEGFVHDQADNKRKTAFQEISKVYIDEHDRLHTYDDRFGTQLAELRAKRLVASVKRAKANCPKNYKPTPGINANGVQPRPDQDPSSTSLELSRFYEIMVWHSQNQYPLTSVYDIHDILSAYYYSSIYHYLEKVKKIANQLIMSEHDSFFHCLDQDWVFSLSKNDLKDIAGEQADITAERRRITDLIEKLEEAVRLSEEIRPRTLRANKANTGKSSNETLRTPKDRFRSAVSECGSGISAQDGSRVRSGRTSPSFSEGD